MSMPAYMSTHTEIYIYIYIYTGILILTSVINIHFLILLYVPVYISIYTCFICVLCKCCVYACSRPILQPGISRKTASTWMLFLIYT